MTGRVMVVVTVSVSLPASDLISTVVVLAGSHCSTGIHAMVVVLLTVTSVCSATGGDSSYRHLGHVVFIPNQRAMQSLWKK